MAGEHYRYRREDFGELLVTLNHLTIYLNFLGDFVEASNLLDMTARRPLEQVALDAKNLQVIRIEWLEDPADLQKPCRQIDYHYLKDESKLLIKLPRPVRAEERFFIKTLTRCVPTDNILEGIYKDTTPPRAPQQYMSQCQQWGFQRIMPILDDCRAKCTMTTTIEADAAYTHLISNGNINAQTNPGGVPVLKPGDPTRKIITFENAVPMAPYLFLVCVGTWDSVVDQVTYNNGKTVRLEYLVPPGRADGARLPMEILKKAVQWLADTQEYTYPADVYRTICMNKSNFGGMENVGNTTVVTDAALIDEHTLDQQLLYCHSVIVHEFEHNQCGSETTMETPFDVWLNEAYTVHVERQFVAQVFDPTFVRLNQVDGIRSPLLGPLAVEDSGRAGRIVRGGFNNPDELVDAVTYIKAAEVIRMLSLVLGKENFLAGKRLYFSRYKNYNANTDQFFECFEEVSRRSLEQFKQGWLHRIGYPKVTAAMDFDSDNRSCTITLRQEIGPGDLPYHVPIELALVDTDGGNIPGTERLFELTEREGRLVFDNLRVAPAFASLNRGYSFYGDFRQEGLTLEGLALQARLDTDPFNRVESMRRLTDIQRVGLLLEPDRAIETQWLSVYGEMLSDRRMSPGLKAYFLRIDEQPIDRTYATWFQELVAAREKLMKAVNAAYRERLVSLFNEMNAYQPGDSPNDGIEHRLLKHVLLELIGVDDSPESHRFILKHFRSVRTATDRVSALIALNRTSALERRQVLEAVYQDWHSHISGYGNYLRVVASGTQDDLFDAIEHEKSRPTFDVTQPTWTRALFLTTAANNKKVWTDRGIQWVADTVIWMSAINEYTASRLLNTFQHCRNLRPKLRPKVQDALERVCREVPGETSPTIQSQARAYLGQSQIA